MAGDWQKNAPWKIKREKRRRKNQKVIFEKKSGLALV